MMHRLIMLILCLSAGAATAQNSNTEAALQILPKSVQRAYVDRYLAGNVPRAFAIDSSGHYGWAVGATSLETARSRALEFCAKTAVTACQLFAEDLSIVWPGHNSSAAAPPPPPKTLFGQEKVYKPPLPPEYFKSPIPADACPPAGEFVPFGEPALAKQPFVVDAGAELAALLNHESPPVLPELEYT
jgi:hypothetical protein